MAYLGSCTTCTNNGNTWCGGAYQTCVALASQCAAAAPCSVTSGLSCATYGGTTCGASSTAAADAESAARVLIAKGVAASLVVGAFVGLLAICVARCRPPGMGAGSRNNPAMAAWRPRAAATFWVLAAGVFFHAIGIAAGLAAPAVPWFFSSSAGSAAAAVTASPLAFVTTTWAGASLSGAVSQATAGAIVSYVSMVLSLPAFALAVSALGRVSAVANTGVAPPVMRVGPGMPAVQGLAWAGALAFCAGAAADWHYLGVIRRQYVGGGAGPGEALMAGAAALLVAAAACFSVAAAPCVLGPLPGLGTARGNCCSTEQNPDAQPPEAAAAAAAAAAAHQKEPLPPPVGLQVRFAAQAAPPAPREGKWDCPVCTLANAAAVKVCGACGVARS